MFISSSNYTQKVKINFFFPMVSVQPHILLVAFPFQGHINPSFQFAKKLLRSGVKVTFATSLSALHRINTTSKVPDGLNFAPFSDGSDDGQEKDSGDITDFLTEFRSRGSKSLKETIFSFAANEGPPVTCLVYTIFLHWAAEVAREHHVPSALLWIQPAAMLDIYYYHFNGYSEIFGDDRKVNPSWSIELPGLPLLRSRDIPSFSLHSNTHQDSVLPQFKEQIDLFDAEEKPKVLVNTFDALEPEAVKAVDKLKMIAVGPLIPSAFLSEKDPSDRCFGGDLFEKSKDYVDWMSSKPEGSIVYISFGSFLMLPKKQNKEMAHALLEMKRPFLWVIRDNNGGKKGEERKEVLSCGKELEGLGMIVPWCDQLEVLSHPSLGCFVTHCGWNSTIESIVCGVPVVAFPHWLDQLTNAKLLEDVWRMGVRVTADEEGFVEGEEIKKCIEIVMGGDERGVEMRKNANKWKDLGTEATKEGGSSDMNLKAFIEEIGGGSAQN